MATETAEEGDAEAEEAEGWDSHLRGLTVTTFASLLGMAAGIGSSALAGGPGDRIGLYLAAGAVLVQIPVYSVVGIDVDDFGPKEYLYIAFMTFSMWFITWGILLTTGASI
jgi:hypothetical protein